MGFTGVRTRFEFGNLMDELSAVDVMKTAILNRIKGANHEG